MRIKASKFRYPAQNQRRYFAGTAATAKPLEVWFYSVYGALDPVTVTAASAMSTIGIVRALSPKSSTASH